MSKRLTACYQGMVVTGTAQNTAVRDTDRKSGCSRWPEALSASQDNRFYLLGNARVANGLWRKDLKNWSGTSWGVEWAAKQRSPSLWHNMPYGGGWHNILGMIWQKSELGLWQWEWKKRICYKWRSTGKTDMDLAAEGIIQFFFFF